MKLGLSIPQVGVNATRENALKLAQAAEKENFESLWVQERILWPINPHQNILPVQMEVYEKNTNIILILLICFHILQIIPQRFFLELELL